MNKFILSIAFILAGNFVFSQNNYDDLINLQIDEKYEKLLYKAEKYVLGEKTKKDPLPYLLMSIGYFEISKLSEMKEDYPKAFKNALKYAVKYRKKDKNDEFFNEYTDYFEELRTATITEAEIFYEMEKYSKVKGYYKYLFKIDDFDTGAHVMYGVCMDLLKSKKEALTAYEKGQQLLNDNGCDNLTEAQTLLLKIALIRVAEHQSGLGNSADAKEWMKKGEPCLGEDNEYKMTMNGL